MKTFIKLIIISTLSLITFFQISFSTEKIKIQADEFSSDMNENAAVFRGNVKGFVPRENIELTTIYTPGHTNCSYSFFMKDRVFTGDTLLINGTGRTDFQNGSAFEQYDSIFNKLLKLPDKTFVYPAHDYNGKKFSTIKNEKNNNPRLQVKSAQEYVQIMNNLNLSSPKLMDIVIPANIKGVTNKN